MAWQKEIGAPEDKLNPNGGAIALGHPLGGSGARILTDMIFHMRRTNLRYGLQTMCEGGGQANQRHHRRIRRAVGRTRHRPLSTCDA
ncbi:hypothetical protein A5767_09435 [Rhodococcus sp. 852002-51564_SCH6189132-a]|nr:hypothetical protein A5767_09435 [Rhodococcus sp. 852002-51564_SCH6189132-a]